MSLPFCRLCNFYFFIEDTGTTRTVPGSATTIYKVRSHFKKSLRHCKKSHLHHTSKRQQTCQTDSNEINTQHTNAQE